MPDGAQQAHVAAAPPLLRLEALSYRPDEKTLVDGIGLEVPRGKRLALLGPNGAGKSLTLRMVQGLIRPIAGRLLWSEGTPTGHRRSALVFQRPVLLRRSVVDNLRHALAAYGCPRAERAERAMAWLDKGGLAHLARRPARVLSGGEQQRLALLRALAAEPALLLLDEPTASLDPQATLAIERLIGAAHRQGTTVMLVTHDMGQARRLADRVAFLHHGRLTEVTPARYFFDAAESREAQAYLDGRLLL